MIRIKYAYGHSDWSDDLDVDTKGSFLLTYPILDFTVEKAKKIIEELVPTLYPNYRSYVTRVDKVEALSSRGTIEKVIFDRNKDVDFEGWLRKLGYEPLHDDFKTLHRGGLPKDKLIPIPFPDTYVTKDGNFPRYKLEVHWGYKDFEDSQSIMKVECYQLVDGKKEELVSLPIEEMRVISKFI